MTEGVGLILSMLVERWRDAAEESRKQVNASAAGGTSYVVVAGGGAGKPDGTPGSPGYVGTALGAGGGGGASTSGPAFHDGRAVGYDRAADDLTAVIGAMRL